MMKPWQFFTVLLLAVVCVGLSVATLVMSQSNGRLQTELQASQNKLNSGVFSAQGQQIAGNILQAIAAESTEDPLLRELLRKHGYNVNEPTAAEAPRAKETGPRVSDDPPTPKTSSESPDSDPAASTGDSL